MDWKPFVPTDNDRQESPMPWAETNGCMSFAVVHYCEMVERFLYGNENDYSEQIVTVGSGTNPINGNSLGNVYNWLKGKGLVKTSVSPEPVNFTVSQFYTMPVADKVGTGQDWLNQWSVGDLKRITDLSTIPQALEEYPILITLDLTGQGQFHEVVLINEKEYFDSYSTLIKPLTQKILYAYQIPLIRKTMSNAVFVHNLSAKNSDGTPNPNEYGFYIPKLSQDALKDQALNFGQNILTDGAINFPSAKGMSLN